MVVIGLDSFFRNEWKALGFIMNARNDMRKLALVEKDGDYAVLPYKHFKNTTLILM